MMSRGVSRDAACLRSGTWKIALHIVLDSDIQTAQTLGSPLVMAVASTQQRDQYRRLASKLLDIEFPEAYLKRGIVYVVTDREGIVSGGAILIVRPPFRSVQGLPRLIQRHVRHRLDFAALAEVNGVCLKETLRAPHTSSTFWRSLLAYALLTERKQFLFSLRVKADCLPAIYLEAKPEVIYSGTTRKLPGMQQPAEETTAVVSAEAISGVLEMLRRWCGEC